MVQLSADELKRQKYQRLLKKLYSIRTSESTLLDNFESLKISIDETVNVDKEAYLIESVKKANKVCKSVRTELATTVIPSVSNKS